MLTCKPGQEELLIKSCKRNLSESALEDVFQLSYERMKKYLGQWHTDTYQMFPGYVFLQSAHPKLLREELRRYCGTAGILEQDQLLLPVDKREEQLFRMLCGERHHMALSYGSLRNGRLHVTEGPLAGKESLIQRLDLHKRIAILNLRLTEKDRTVWAGIHFMPESK